MNSLHMQSICLSSDSADSTLFILLSDFLFITLPISSFIYFIADITTVIGIKSCTPWLRSIICQYIRWGILWDLHCYMFSTIGVSSSSILNTRIYDCEVFLSSFFVIFFLRIFRQFVNWLCSLPLFLFWIFLILILGTSIINLICTILIMFPVLYVSLLIRYYRFLIFCFVSSVDPSCVTLATRRFQLLLFVKITVNGLNTRLNVREIPI